MNKASCSSCQVFSSTRVRPCVRCRPRLTPDTNNSEREITRKKYISSLENRTPEQIVEEEALYIEIKRLEQNERKFRKERDELLRTLAGIESGLPDLHVDEDGLNLVGGLSAGGSGSMFDKKKKKGWYDLDSPSTPSNIIALGPPIVKRPPVTKHSAVGELIPLIRRLTF